MIKKFIIIFAIFLSMYCFVSYGDIEIVQADDIYISYYENTGIDPVEDDYTLMTKNVKLHGEWVLWDAVPLEENAISVYIQKVLAYFLWITAVLAVFVLLYGAVGIFSPKSDEWLQKSMKYIKWAVIALLAIALSWFFVMLIFYVYTQAM